MSADISRARRILSEASFSLKQNKLLPVAKAMHDAAEALIRGGLTQAERQELVRLILNTSSLLQHHGRLRGFFPLAITYTPGQEQQLLDTIDQLSAYLESEAYEEAKQGLDSFRKKQKNLLHKGKVFLTEGKHDQAREIFQELQKQFPEDAELHTQIGDALLDEGLFAEAAHCFTLASKYLPASAHVLNRFGISLRKLKKFDASEEKFLKALSMEPNDPNLLFNLGRLYLDMGKWEECLRCGEGALGLEPTFTEASKMIIYCKRKLGQDQD